MPTAHGLSASLRPFSLSLLAALSFACLGCGTEYYEERLQESQKQFQYFQQVEERLTKEWKGGGVTLRVPKQFTLIPAPEPSDGEPRRPERDPRQPSLFSNRAYLPGIMGAWQNEVASGGAKLPAYIYVLSNAELRENEDQQELANNFHKAVQDQLLSGLNLLQSTALTWPAVKVPDEQTPAYIPRSSYSREVFSPTIDGVPYLVSAYLFTFGDSLGAIIHMRPKASPSALEDDLKLSMHTAQFSATKSKKSGETESAF